MLGIEKKKMNCLNVQLIISICLLSMPSMISSVDFFGFMLKKNNTAENYNNSQRKFGSDILTTVSNKTKNVGGYIVHRGHYDDGVISEEIEYNTTDTTPSFDFPKKVLTKVTDTAHKVGEALYLIPHKKETDGLDTDKSFFDGVATTFKNYLKAIYPGTQWCGGGDRARSYDDLGTFKSTDMCCRAHDKCPDSITVKETKHELTNTGLFTRSHCNCDEEFYNCLQKSNTIVSKKIGFTYFTVLGPQCFKEEYPIIGCVLYRKGKCIEYHLDDTEEKIYQWFDSPPFSTKR